MLKFIWKDRKRPIFGLPLSFTRYRLTEEKLIVLMPMPFIYVVLNIAVF